MRQNLSSTPMRIDNNRYNIMYRTSIAFPAVAIIQERNVAVRRFENWRNDGAFECFPRDFPEALSHPQLTQSRESAPDTPTHAREQTCLPIRIL